MSNKIVAIQPAPCRFALRLLLTSAIILTLCGVTQRTHASDVYLLKMEQPLVPLPTIDVVLDSQFGTPVTGWSISICHDPGEVEFNGAYSGTALNNLPSPPQFEAITPFSNGFTYDCVIDSTFVLSLPLEENLQLYTVDYLWVPTGSMWSDLTFCNTPGSSSGATIQSAGSSASPYTFEIFLFNGFVDPFAIYDMPLYEGTYDGGSGSGSITVEPRILPGFIPTFELTGLSMGVSHDGSLLEVANVEPSGDFAEAFGGTGPEIVLIEIFDDGWTIDMTVDTTGMTTVSFNGPIRAAQATYSTIPSGIPLGSCVSSWLQFDNSLGVDNELDFQGFGSGSAVLQSNIVVLNPVLTNFIRGDVNSDSAINLADAIAQLDVLFGSSGSADCTDSADTNDDGAFNIADTIYLLSFLFSGGASPAEPFGVCGLDPTADALGCSSTPCP